MNPPEQVAAMSFASTRKRIAVLISGRGSNLEAIIKAIGENALPATISIVISNKEDAAGLEIAKAAEIPTEVVNHKLFAKRQDFEMEIHRHLMDKKTDFVVLAGFMRMFSSWFCDRWANRLINIHPSLLPAFTGLDTHRRAIESGAKMHGCTVISWCTTWTPDRSSLKALFPCWTMTRRRNSGRVCLRSSTLSTLSPSVS